jgi:hypothetical protein
MNKVTDTLSPGGRRASAAIAAHAPRTGLFSNRDGSAS